MQQNDIVICIDDSLPNTTTFVVFDYWVSYGQEYTVRRNERSLSGRRRMLLKELVNSLIYSPEVMGMMEPGYAEHRFKKKLDMTIDELKEINHLKEKQEDDFTKQREIGKRMR